MGCVEGCPLVNFFCADLILVAPLQAANKNYTSVERKTTHPLRGFWKRCFSKFKSLWNFTRYSETSFVCPWRCFVVQLRSTLCKVMGANLRAFVSFWIWKNDYVWLWSRTFEILKNLSEGVHYGFWRVKRQVIVIYFSRPPAITRSRLWGHISDIMLVLTNRFNAFTKRMVRGNCYIVVTPNPRNSRPTQVKSQSLRKRCILS